MHPPRYPHWRHDGIRDLVDEWRTVCGDAWYRVVIYNYGFGQEATLQRLGNGDPQIRSHRAPDCGSVAESWRTTLEEILMEEGL